jgi:hypothetical protein
MCLSLNCQLLRQKMWATLTDPFHRQHSLTIALQTLVLITDSYSKVLNSYTEC